GTELVLPGRVAQHHNRLATGSRDVPGEEHSTHHRTDPEHVEVIPSHEFAEDRLTLDASLDLVDRRDFQERRVFIPEVLELRPGKLVAGTGLICPEERVETVWVSHGDGP